MGGSRAAGATVLLIALLTVLPGCAGAPVVAPGAVTVQRIEVSYAGGAVLGGVSRIPVGLGRAVQLVVRSDVADEVHVHGYDRKVPVAAGGSATVQFVADQAGVFEVELESRGVQVAQLEVR